MSERSEPHSKSDESVREHAVSLLSGHGAHLPFEQAVADVPEHLRGVVPDGAACSLWQQLEHLRIAQWDILEFSRDPGRPGRGDAVPSARGAGGAVPRHLSPARRGRRRPAACRRRAARSHLALLRHLDHARLGGHRVPPHLRRPGGVAPGRRPDQPGRRRRLPVRARLRGVHRRPPRLGRGDPRAVGEQDRPRFHHRGIYSTDNLLSTTGGCTESGSGSPDTCAAAP